MIVTTVYTHDFQMCIELLGIFYKNRTTNNEINGKNIGTSMHNKDVFIFVYCSKFLRYGPFPKRITRDHRTLDERTNVNSNPKFLEFNIFKGLGRLHGLSFSINRLTQELCPSHH